MVCGTGVAVIVGKGLTIKTVEAEVLPHSLFAETLIVYEIATELGFG